jgi:hypothetical protein
MESLVFTLEEVTPATLEGSGMLRDIQEEHRLAAAIRAERWDAIDEDLDVQMNFNRVFGSLEESKRDRDFYLDSGEQIRREWLLQWLKNFKNAAWCFRIAGMVLTYASEEARRFVENMPGDWEWLPNEGCWFQRYGDPAFRKKRAFWAVLSLRGVPVMCMTVQHYVGTQTNYHMYIARTLQSFKLHDLPSKLPALLVPFHSRVLAAFPEVTTLRINPVPRVMDLLLANKNLEIEGRAPLVITVNDYLRHAWKECIRDTLYCINCRVREATLQVDGQVPAQVYCSHAFCSI